MGVARREGREPCPRAAFDRVGTARKRAFAHPHMGPPVKRAASSGV
jgi:hypothetical protein